MWPHVCVGALLTGVKCMGHEAGDSPPFGVEVKNKGSDTSAHPHMSWTAL